MMKPVIITVEANFAALKTYNSSVQFKHAVWYNSDLIIGVKPDERQKKLLEKNFIYSE